MRLPDLPDTFIGTRDALHQLAFFAIAPKRYANTERLGLRAQPGLFGTPPWNGGDQVWVEGAELVIKDDGQVRRIRITTLNDACAFLGIEYREVWFDDFHDPLDPVGPDVPLDVDEAAAVVLGHWFDFATAALEALRATPGAIDPSEVQLWPEHFDPATELGSTDDETRASYGGSPGDADHDQPYLYVGPWYGKDDGDAFWNDDAFGGASITYARLRAADDPLQTAIEFLRQGYAKLTS